MDEPVAHVASAPPRSAPSAPSADMPEVDASDDFVRRAAAALAGHPEVARWLVGENLAARLVAAVDNVAEGRSPRSHARVLAPPGVFLVRGGGLWTPPASDGALEGITRATVLELARDLGIPAAERTLGRFDLFAADEVFLTGSGAGLVPVRSFDGRAVGGGAPGLVTEKIAAAFADAVVGLGTPF